MYELMVIDKTMTYNIDMQKQLKKELDWENRIKSEYLTIDTIYSLMENLLDKRENNKNE